MKSKVVLALTIATVLGLGFAGGSAAAQQPVVRRPPPPRPTSPCRVSLEDARGHTLSTYYAGGRTYVLGEQGERYSIRVRNRSGERVEAVVTVDGRDVINGQPGNYVRHRGYVVDGYDSVSIRGFRQSLDNVATFRFSSPRDSYSSRMGTPHNVGVIGVACFRERYAPVVVHPPYQSHPKRSGGSAESRDEAAPSAKRRPGSSAEGYAPPPRSTHNLGTEYGESRYAPVSTTSFVREHASRPQQLVSIHYDDAEGLEARGIRVYWFPAPQPVYVPPPPQPFPDTHFAPPPPR